MPRYGVSCRSICNIIIMRETTKARAMSCCSRYLLRLSQVCQVRLAVENGSADYSSTTGAPHEYFGQAASIKRPMPDEFVSPCTMCEAWCATDSKLEGEVVIN